MSSILFIINVAIGQKVNLLFTGNKKDYFLILFFIERSVYRQSGNFSVTLVEIVAYIRKNLAQFLLCQDCLALLNTLYIIF